MCVDVDELRRDLQRRRTLVAHMMYECSSCGERQLGERRCAECGLFGHALGLAGTCPGCDEPILLAELLGLEQRAGLRMIREITRSAYRSRSALSSDQFRDWRFMRLANCRMA